jgi:dTDP-4-dehydrorhamnose 3,5-epimerase
MLTSLYQPTAEKQVADRIFSTTVSGLWYIAHSKHGDNRGFFSEIGLLPDLETVIGHPFVIKQINLARSSDYVTRGIHCENWNKYVTVIRGSCFCAIADVVSTSPTFKQVETFMLGDGDQDLDGSLYISKGLGNSLCGVKGPVDYLYAVDALYRDRDTSGDQAISLFDPELAIEWPIPKDQMIISDRDSQSITLAERDNR